MDDEEMGIDDGKFLYLLSADIDLFVTFDFSHQSNRIKWHKKFFSNFSSL